MKIFFNAMLLTGRHYLIRSLFGLLLIVSCSLSFGVPKDDATAKADKKYTFQHWVSGQITDNDGIPLPGANVLIKGTLIGAVSDIDGQYRIETTNPDAVLVISYVGYLTEEIALEGRTELNVMLFPEISYMDEVLVVGYGTQKKSDLTGSVAAINAEDLRNVPSAGIDRALQGRVAGVTINANGGAPGGRTSIRIRGMGSIYSGNDPLFVVDGIPLASNTRIENIVNSADIERIDILKDASAAAIYGSRGSNGVILVTTKRGKSGEPRITINSYAGTQNPVSTPRLANAEEYVSLAKLAHTNAGRQVPAFFNSREEGEWGEGTNWWNEILRDGGGSMQSHDFSISGGTDDFTYSSSINYFNNKGYVKHSEYDRINFSLNTDYRFMKFFQAGSNLRYSNLGSRGVNENNPEGGAIALAYQIPPTEDKWKNETLLNETAAAGFDITETINRYNPINSTTNSNIARQLEQNNAHSKQNMIFGTLFLQGEFFNHLTLRTEYGVDVRRTDFYNFSPVYFSSPNEQNPNSSVHRDYHFNNNWVHNNTATWAQSIGSHSFSLLAGYTRESFSYENLNSIGRNTPSNNPSFWYINSTIGDREVYGGASRHTLMSVLGRAFYSYDNRYMITMNVRRDGTSKFSDNYRWGLFPSVSAGWNLHNESFFESLDLRWVSAIKFRGSWGRIGNQSIPNNAYIGTLVSNYTDRYAFGTDEVFHTAYRPANNANPNVRWETQETTNFGTDMEFYDRRVQLTADYFIRTTVDNLLLLPQPIFSGAPGFWANAGKIQNKGLEISAKYLNYDRQFTYSFGGNIAFLSNEVLELGFGNESMPSGANTRIGGRISNTVVGQPIAMFWGYKVTGVFQTEEEVQNYVNADGELIQPNAKPGDFIFADIGGEFDENGNPLPDGRINDNDRAAIGSPHPRAVFGANLNMGYRGLNLDIFLQGQYGNDIFMYQRYYNYKGFESNFNQVNGLASSFWNGEGSTNSQPALNPFSRNNNYRLSDWWLSDGSYLRVKNITLSYSLPANIINRAGLSGVTIYVTGENLFTFTNYEGLDPELGTAGDYSLEIGVDRYLYPVARTILTGIRLNF
jgi:TonB-dependent starch-binding outer membrane protein SusC